MVLRSLRVLLAAAIATSACVPGSSDGCEFLRRIFGGGQQTTYMPIVAPVCNPCTSCATPAASYYAAPGCTTCSATAVPVTAGYTAFYVPQTYYRPIVQNVAVTALRPAAAYNPYTGSIQTVYRPVTTFRPLWTVAPTTSYRIAYAPTVCCPTSCSSVVAPVVSGCSGCSTPAMGAAATSELSPIPSSSSGWSESPASSSIVPQSTVVSPQTRQDPQSTVNPDLRGTPSKPPVLRSDDRSNVSPYNSGSGSSGNGDGQPARSSSTTGSSFNLIAPPAERTTFRAQLPKIGYRPEAAPQVMLASRHAGAVGAAPVVSADGWEAAD